MQNVLSGRTDDVIAAERALETRRRAEAAAYEQLNKLHAAMGDDFFAQTGIVLPKDLGE